MNTYTELRDGSWGVRVAGSTKPGAVVTVTKRDGSTKRETIARVLWQGDGVSLCTIERAGSKVAPRAPAGRFRSRKGGTYECDECGERVMPGTQCWETGMAHESIRPAPARRSPPPARPASPPAVMAAVSGDERLPLLDLSGFEVAEPAPEDGRPLVPVMRNTLPGNHIGACADLSPDRTEAEEASRAAFEAEADYEEPPAPPAKPAQGWMGEVDWDAL